MNFSDQTTYRNIKGVLYASISEIHFHLKYWIFITYKKVYVLNYKLTLKCVNLFLFIDLQVKQVMPLNNLEIISS